MLVLLSAISNFLPLRNVIRDLCSTSVSFASAASPHLLFASMPVIDDYYGQIIGKPFPHHRHRVQQYYDPYYDSYCEPLTALELHAMASHPRRQKVRRCESEEISDEEHSEIEKATRAHVEATREHEKIKEKFEDIKKSFEQSEAKVKAAAKKLERAKKNEANYNYGYRLHF